MFMLIVRLLAMVIATYLGWHYISEGQHPQRPTYVKREYIDVACTRIRPTFEIDTPEGIRYMHTLRCADEEIQVPYVQPGFRTLSWFRRCYRTEDGYACNSPYVRTPPGVYRDEIIRN